MTKDQARADSKRLRASLSEEDKEILSQRMADTFLEQVDLRTVQHLNCFLPLAHHNEPDTLPLLERLHRSMPKVTLSVPHLPKGAKDIVPARWEPGMDMQEGHHRTHHPTEAEELLFSQLDMVLVPLLAYDQFGYRAGYGAGYYDRFLARCRPATKKIGLTFFEPIDSLDDIHAEDIRLDACVTPDRLHLFNPEAGLKGPI